MALSLETDYVESLERLAAAVGTLLDGPNDDKSDTMDAVIRFYDESRSILFDN